MAEMVRFSSTAYLSTLGFSGEINSSRETKNPNSRSSRCHYTSECLGSITWIDHRNSSRSGRLQHAPIIGETFLHYRCSLVIMHCRRLIAQSSFRSCLIGKVENEMAVSDSKEIDELSADESGKRQVFSVDDQILEDLHRIPFSHVQSRFTISELSLQNTEGRDEEALSKKILSLSKSNKLRSALGFYLSMNADGLKTSAHACNSLMACLIRNKLVNDALVVFEMVRKTGLPTSHTCSLVIKAVAGSNGFKSAMEMFSSFEEDEAFNHAFDIILYNTMISICVKAKKWIEAEKMWEKFKQNALTGSMITYSLLISAFVQCGITELALSAYHEMISRGLEPDKSIMKAMVASCTKDGKWALALKMLRKMVDSGMNPCAITYNSVISCLGKAGEDALAFRVYELMLLSGLTSDAYTWSALLNALYRSKHYEDALRLFQKLEMFMISQSNCHLYDVALRSCHRLGLWQHSLELLLQMEKREIEMSTASYNHVIRACETARKPEIALQVYQRMIDQKHIPDVFTYLSLLRTCIWGSLWIEVENLFERIPLDASLYNALVQGFFLRGKVLSAKKMYEKMRQNGVEPDGKTRAMMLQHLSCNGIHQSARGCRY